MQPLEKLQQTFFSALLLPLRGSSRAATELPLSNDSHAPEFFRIADEIIKPGPALSSAERLELYHRQYWFRILDSLAEDFPILRRMTDETFFWSLIESYLLARPSRSYTLRHLGEAFPTFLANSPLLSSVQRTWLSSIARIEYAFMECFESAQSAIPQPADLQSAIIELQDYVKILHLPVPADLAWEWETFPSAAVLPSGDIQVAVWRGTRGHSHHERLDPVETILLEKLQSGITLADLFESLPEPTPSADDITHFFAKWQNHRWLGVRGQPADHELDANTDWHGIDRMSSQTLSL